MGNVNERILKELPRVRVLQWNKIRLRLEKLSGSATGIHDLKKGERWQGNDLLVEFRSCNLQGSRM